MSSGVKTETETVVKKILPYLSRRGYDPTTDLDFETSVKTTDRYSRGYVDIVVTVGKTKPQFLIEAKRSSKKLTAKDRNQALEYGRALKVPFVVVTNGTEVQCFNTVTEKPIKWNGRLDEKIPTRQQLGGVLSALKADKTDNDISLGTDSTLPFRPGLPLKQLNALFARCHNAIRKIEKNEENAFADFSKLLFLKLLEEKADISDFVLPYSYRFHELAVKPESENDQVKDAILQMIAAVKKKTPYGDVLAEQLHLTKPKTFKYIVSALAAVSFHDSSLDTKGAAFEYFVRATLKGKKLGQYFTPRPLVQLMTHLVGRSQIVNSLTAGSDVKVLDPACGTGGFLVFLMKDALSLLQEKSDKNLITAKTRAQLESRIKTAVFYGSDANEGVACAAKMNMIIAGDGHTNIRAEDSLANSAQNWVMSKPDADMILTNPPFGTSEADSLMAADMDSYPIRSARGQFLFLQKMVLCTLQHGPICTVIDEGVLNTDSAAELRRWMFQKCRVVGVVRLPETTFKPNKINVRASVLYLQRREVDDVDLEDDYAIAFVDVRSLGYTAGGESIRGFNFPKLLAEAEESMILGKTSPREGYQWSGYNVPVREIVDDSRQRLDFKYWLPATRTRIAELLDSGAPTIAQLNQIPTGRGKSPPADVYVDEGDGYALVVKAGTNISRYGELVRAGDYIEKNLFDELDAARTLKDGDVLLASTGEGTLGKCCVYRGDQPAIADQHVTIIRVDSTVVDPEYLADFLRVGFGAEQIDRLYTGSTGLIELTTDSVDTIVVDLLTGVDEQKEKSHRLREAEAAYRAAIDAARVDLETARRSMLG